MVRIVLGSLLSVFLAVMARADWKPDAHPEPRRILQEARGDAAAGRYEDALAKHLWFHENALKYAPELDGVRLSFALESWTHLGASYPPALEKLRQARENLREGIRSGKRKRAEEVATAFHEFAAINRALGDEPGTVALFLWLDANRPPLAKAAYEAAETSLIAAKAYAVCGKYLDNTAFSRLLSAREKSMKEAATPGRLRPDQLNQYREFVERVFAAKAATLVALLTLNDRVGEAQRIALKAQAVRDDAEFREQLAKALQGEIPAW
jgi:hypothetical protein